MNKIDPFAIFLYVVFIFVIVVLSAFAITKMWITFIVKSDVPLYSRPTLVTESTEETTTKVTATVTTTTVEIETGAGLYGED